MADEPIRKPRGEAGLMPPVEQPTLERAETEEESFFDAEKAAEIPDEAEDADQLAPAKPPAPAPVERVQAPVVQKDRLAQEIESVLQEDLTEMYLKLSPAKQKQFAKKGDETAQKIHHMVSKAKVNAHKVFELIRDWLKIISGVNKFFLEQEAKIKTDKILLVAEEEKRRGPEEIA